jgi:hypothetical protein
MTTFDTIMNIAVPTILILIAFGFVYMKFLRPFVMPWLIKLWLWITGQNQESTINHKKEIIYE